MKNKIFYSVLSLLLFVHFSYAQQKKAAISFNETEHNFGKVKEDGGVVTHRFEFINTGSQPLLITDVKASCGCTTPDWSKAPVLSGQKGFINVTFNPAGRPGNFQKTITVTSNAEPTTTQLFIKGEVNTKAPTVQDNYPVSLGDLRMKTNHLSFGKLLSNKTETKFIEIINLSSKPLSVGFKNLPKHLSIKVEPSTLAPNQTGKMAVTYNATIKKDWDYVFDDVQVLVNEQVPTGSRLTVSADIQEDFSNVNTEKAPNIDFEKKEVNFGTLKEGEKTTQEFVFKNTGKKDLIIRKITASCGCTAAHAENNTIKAGKSGKIIVTFDSTGKTGQQNKVLTVISNAPSNSKTNLYIKGSIEKK